MTSSRTAIHRHRARRLALQGLCCLDAQGPGAAELVHEFLADSHETPETIGAAHVLLRDAYADREACDEMLARHARHWELHRLARLAGNLPPRHCQHRSANRTRRGYRPAAAPGSAQERH